MVTRKQYTKEFKLNVIGVISWVLNQSHTTTEASRSLGINANMLRKWIREYQADDADQAVKRFQRFLFYRFQMKHQKIIEHWKNYRRLLTVPASLILMVATLMSFTKTARH